MGLSSLVFGSDLALGDFVLVFTGILEADWIILGNLLSVRCNLERSFLETDGGLLGIAVLSLET